MTLLPILVYWGFAFWGLFSRRHVLFFLFCAVQPLGAMAVIPTGLSGGVTLVGSPMTALLIVLREFLLRRSGPGTLAALALRGDGALLFLFWCLCLVVTLFSPRVFAGLIEISPMVPIGFAQSALLYPTVQNFTQMVYITVSILTVFAFLRIWRRSGGEFPLLQGLMLMGWVLIGTGMLDHLSTSLPLTPLLDMFRTAHYAIIDGAFIEDGTKRVAGLMPESSVFAGLTLTVLSMLWFMRHLSRRRQRPALYAVIAGLTLMLVISTSSAGYVGIGVFAVMVAAEWLYRASPFGKTAAPHRGLRLELVLALLMMLCVMALVLARPALFDPAIARIQEMVFEKTETRSYLERSFWTRVSYEAGLSSYLIGVGLGATRASNFAAVIFGSTGLLGFTLYFGFVLRRILQPAPGGPPQAAMMLGALKWSFWPPFAVSLLIGTTPDFGVLEAMRWGLMLAIPAGATLAAQHIPVQRPARRPVT